MGSCWASINHNTPEYATKSKFHIANGNNSLDSNLLSTV